MKNDFFHLKRFGTYFSTDLLNCYRNYRLSMLILSLLGLTVYFFNILFRLLFLGVLAGGEPIGLRIAIFVMALLILLITFPKKCYGQITDRKRGTDFILLPASTFEKGLSMVLSCCVVAPAVFLVIFLGVDAMVCAIDAECHPSLLNIAGNAFQTLSEFSSDVKGAWQEGIDMGLDTNSISKLFSPCLYIDDFMCISLFFILGTLIFKSGKISKTLGVLIVGSMLLSMVTSPIIIHILGNAEEGITSPDFLYGLLKNAVWLDCVNDTLVNAALLAGIYFRLKTIKL